MVDMNGTPGGYCPSTVDSQADLKLLGLVHYITMNVTVDSAVISDDWSTAAIETAYP
jgi:hypothetical protein